MSFPSALTRTFEALNLRGAPSLLRMLNRTPLRTLDARVRLPTGQTISFPAYDPYWARYLYAEVAYEPDVELIFRRLAAGRTLIDCGANIGYWSVRSAELGFVDAIAIEANETLITYLRQNHSGSVLHAAVHSRSGEMMHLHGDGANATLGPAGKPVRSIALRDLKLAKPVVVKLDVEGAEIAAIEGARGMDAIFVYEDWPRSGMPVTRHLLETGFTVFGFDMRPIMTLDEALAFNKRTTTTYGPSNLIAMQPTTLAVKRARPISKFPRKQSPSFPR